MTTETNYLAEITDDGIQEKSLEVLKKRQNKNKNN